MSGRAKVSTAPLVAALQEYDESRPARDAAWADANDGPTTQACIDADEAALIKVQDAFYEVTKHINSREHCALVDIDYARRIAALGEI